MMDKKDPYQQIEFLKEDINQFNIDDIDDLDAGRRPPHNGDDDADEVDGDIDEHDNEMYHSQSSQGSSPPRDFDIHADLQYMPIHDDYDDSPSPIDLQKSASSASALSIESDDAGMANSKPVTISKTCRVVRCPECEKPMRNFYCAKCIQKGKFVTLGSFVDESYRSPRARMQFAESSDSLPGFRPVKMDETKLLQETLQVKLRTLKKKTETLQSLYEAGKVKLEQTKRLREEINSQLILEKKSKKAKEGKIELIKRYIVSRKASVKKRRDAESNLIDELKQHVYRRAFQLTNEVFPIEEINLLEQNNPQVNMETSPLLTLSDGSHNQIEHQTAYSIVEPWLSSNGDYSAYSLWVNVNQDHINAPINDSSERNPAYRIGAGLAYTTQLVKNLATYLDVILPAKLDLRTFNCDLLSESQFSYNVAKLNTNIIHLCVSQGVEVSLLNPKKTLKNLMHLFNLNISDLGRKPIMELDNEEAISRIEEQLNPELALIQDDFYDFSKFVDDDDVSDSEWEISESVNPVEMNQADLEQSIHQGGIGIRSGGLGGHSGGGGSSGSSYISRLPLRLFGSFWSTAGNN